MTYQDSTHLSPHRTHWQDGANLTLAVWLFLSPWILGFGGIAGAPAAEMHASWNAWIVGIAVFAIAVGALYREEPWPEWLNLALGAWLFVAPWIFGFAIAFRTAAWDHWIVGAAIGVLALWGASTASMTSAQMRS